VASVMRVEASTTRSTADGHRGCIVPIFVNRNNVLDTNSASQLAEAAKKPPGDSEGLGRGKTRGSAFLCKILCYCKFPLFWAN